MYHQKVTQFATSVKSCKPPEIYKGKGQKLVPFRFKIFHLFAKLLTQDFGDLEFETFHLGN
jgi:hypothetical protein